MISHLIKHKGKGALVILMPIMIGAIVAIVNEGFALNLKNVGGVSFLLSGIILFLLDDKHETITEGYIVMTDVKLPRVKGKNTLLWIEMRYWGMLISVVGIIWLINSYLTHAR